MSTKIIKLHDGSTTYIPITDASVVQYDDSGSKISVQAAIDERPKKIIYIGSCSTSATTATKTVTVETFPLDGNSNPLNGTLIAVKFTVSDKASAYGTVKKLKVNETGAKSVYYDAALIASNAVNTKVFGYKNRWNYYMYDSNSDAWIWINQSLESDTNTKVTSTANHYIPSGTTAYAGTLYNQNTSLNWGDDVVVSSYYITDGKGHITNLTYNTATLPTVESIPVFEGDDPGLVPESSNNEVVKVLGSDGQWKIVTTAQTVEISYNLKYCESSQHQNVDIQDTQLWGSFADPTVATSVFVSDINVNLSNPV